MNGDAAEELAKKTFQPAAYGIGLHFKTVRIAGALAYEWLLATTVAEKGVLDNAAHQIGKVLSAGRVDLELFMQTYENFKRRSKAFLADIILKDKNK